MAKRKRFYVYRIFDALQTVYVGKGSGRRLQVQEAKFMLPGEIIESVDNETKAYIRERHWISELKPTENRCAGGNGSRCRTKRAAKRCETELAMNRVGPRKHIAQFLLRKLNELNCEKYGVSKVELFRLREVANGPWI